jgi:glycerate 2-kinase
MKSEHGLRADASRIWTAALRAVGAETAVRRHLKRQGHEIRVARKKFDLSRAGHVWLIGAGKAAAPMARAFEKILGRYLSGGLVVTKYGHGMPLKKVQLLEAGHPLPDANSAAAAVAMISFIRSQVLPGDLVFCVLSGGASALLSSPTPDFTWEEKQACTHLMLNAGADIHQLNTVRKHLSSLKGGGLARLLAPTPVVALVLSDVVGDRLDTIASGPLAPDPSTFADSVEILRLLQIYDRVPESVRRRFAAGVAGEQPETPKSEDPCFRSVLNVVVGSNSLACSEAAATARRLGYKTAVLTTVLEGDTREAARFHLSIAQEIVAAGRPIRRPACLISGGETTVKVTGTGKGGRNQEFALACARALASLPAPCVVASVGTDGTDGPTDAAGAVADGSTLQRSLKYGATFLSNSLNNNDSYVFFERLGDLIITGPTGTNVADLRLVLIG